MEHFKPADPKSTRAKCPVCKCWAKTYRGNNVSRLGRRFNAHAKDGGDLMLNFPQMYCTGSYQLVPTED